MSRDDETPDDALPSDDAAPEDAPEVEAEIEAEAEETRELEEPREEGAEEATDEGDPLAAAPQADAEEATDEDAGEEEPGEEEHEAAPEEEDLEAARERTARARRDAVEGQVRAVEVLLRKTWRAHQTPLLVEGAVWWATALCAVVLSALALAALIPAAAPEGVQWMLVVGLGASTIGALTALVVARTRRPDELAIARRVQRHAPELRNDLASALVFGRQLVDGSFDPNASDALARLHIKRAEKKARELAEDGHLGHLLPARPLAPAALALTGCASVLLAAWAVAPEWVESTLSGQLDEVAEAIAQRELVRPLVGNLSLTLIYPSYTGLNSRHEPFTTGNVTALEGTELVVQAYGLIQTPESFELVFTGESGERPVAMTIEAGGRLTTKLTLTESGRYTFRATMPDGRVLTDGVERAITVIEDSAPRVEITSHAGELEVSPEDVLTLSVSAADDYGLTTITRVHTFTGTEDDATRVGVPDENLSSGPREWSGEVVLDLRELGLQPKDTITVHVEGRDNNTLTGPGVGKSSPLVLRVSSPEDKHYKNIREQQEVAEALLGLLADALENPVGERAARKDGTYVQTVSGSWERADLEKRHAAYLGAHARQKEVFERMGEVAARLDDDPLMVARDVTMFEAFYQLLTGLHSKGEAVFKQTKPAALGARLTAARLQPLAGHAGEMEAALEKAVIGLDELLQSQKMASVKATAEEIRDLKERLRELLQKYKETKDPELKKAIRREIERLRQRMNELMERMNSQMRRMPQEHVNMDAARQQMMESDASKMNDSFDQIEKLLEEDDIDGALRALDEMTKNLDALTGEMDQQFGDAQPEGLREFDEKVSELMDEVNDLSELQREIEQDTAELREELKAQRERETQEMLEGFKQQLERKLEKQREALDSIDPAPLDPHHRANLERARENLKELGENLDQQDIEGALEKAKEVLDEVERMRMSMQISQRYVPRNSAKGQKLGEALKKSAPVMKRGGEVIEDLEGLIEQAQRMREGQGDPRLDKLGERQGKANERAEKLGKKISEAGEKFPVLKQELEPTMKEARDAMGGAKKGLERGRVQRALDSEREALEKMRKMKKQMQKALENQRQGEQEGRGKTSKEDVAIPGKGEGAGPGYRDSLKKTMKEERLDDYSSEIEDYYKSLVD
jgi:ABC-type transporter Mla subunit MlaD